MVSQFEIKLVDRSPVCNHFK